MPKGVPTSASRAYSTCDLIPNGMELQATSTKGTASILASGIKHINLLQPRLVYINHP